MNHFAEGKFYAEIAVLPIMPTKEQIAEALEEIATLLELKEENPFKIRAYQNAARSIEAFGASFSDLQNQEALEKIPGIGKAIAEVVADRLTTPVRLSRAFKEFEAWHASREVLA